MTSTDLEVQQQLPLAVAVGVPDTAIHHSGLMLTDTDLDIEKWRESGQALGSINRWTRFAIGDWLAFGEVVYPETYADAVEATNADRYDLAQRVTGLEHGTLRNLASMCRLVPHDNRRFVLGVSMHQAVSKLPPGEQAEWLDRAIENGWSRDQLRDAIAGHAPAEPGEPQVVEPVPTRTERIESVAKLVLNQSQPTDDGSVLVPAEVWAQFVALFAEEE